MNTRKRDPQAESISARLLDRAQTVHVDFQILLRRYALEHVLSLIGTSEYGDRFVLKGAFLFYAWGEDAFRTTKDIDFLGSGSMTATETERIFRELFGKSSNAGGLLFDTETIKIERIREVEQYEGVRVGITAFLGKSRIPISIDIGTGDSITPSPVTISFESLLKDRQIVVRSYPAETVIAEKLEAMVKLERYNSRMKDFYDMWVLAQIRSFDGALLSQAIRATFDRRVTAFPKVTPDCLSTEFFSDTGKLAQWNGFVRRTRLFRNPPAFTELGKELCTFALPVLLSAQTGVSPGTWPAGGPWQPERLHNSANALVS